LTTPSISDDKCSSVVGVDVNNDTFNDGDTNKDGMLSAGANGAGETWLFKCTVTVNNVTSDYSSTNVATGHAFDPNNVDITPPLDPDETDTTTVTIHIQ
jgi:hypothetical protein